MTELISGHTYIVKPPVLVQQLGDDIWWMDTISFTPQQIGMPITPGSFVNANLHGQGDLFSLGEYERLPWDAATPGYVHFSPSTSEGGIDTTFIGPHPFEYPHMTIYS